MHSAPPPSLLYLELLLWFAGATVLFARTAVTRARALLGYPSLSVAVWIKLCQRFQLMAPSEEQYAAEIEKTLYNAILRQLGMLTNVPDPLSIAKLKYNAPNIRSFVNMQGTAEALRVPVASCCEGQGTRALGSLPEYVFTLNASAPEEGLFSVAAGPCGTVTVEAW